MKPNTQFSERLSILTNSEKKFIYDLPRFSNSERKHYFDLEKIEEDILHEKLIGINSRVYFILQLGYFVGSANAALNSRLLCIGSLCNNQYHWYARILLTYQNPYSLLGHW